MITAFINFILIFMMWRKYKIWAFLPFIISLTFFPLFGFASQIGNQIGIHKTPCDPNYFFTETNKHGLALIAKQLLQDANEKNIKENEKKLKAYRLELLNVDTCANVVELGYFRARSRYIYIFAKSGLPEIYSAEPIITENDIQSWGELVSIMKSENNPSKYDRASIVFEPEIVYPFLASHLDEKFINKLQNLPAIENLDSFLAKNPTLFIKNALDKRHSDYDSIIEAQLTNEEKTKVIEVLNEYCQAAKQKLQDDNICFISGSLEFCNTMSLSSSFEVNKHLQRLISKGIIKKKGQGRSFAGKREFS